MLKKYSHIWVMAYWLIYLPWFRFLEKNVTDHYAVMHITLDDEIPFNEYFIVPYLLWFVYVAAAFVYYFFTSRQEFYRLCSFLFIGMTISLLICTFFPNGTDLRVRVNPDKNVFCALVHILHKVDTATNVFPSIHVYNSLGVHYSVMNSRQFRGKIWIKSASFVLMLLICMATVFLKQHSVADVIGAVILAWGVYPLVFNTDHVRIKERNHQKVAG